MEIAKHSYDWELVCTGCNEKYFKVRGRNEKGHVLAKCKNCGKVANVKKLKGKRIVKID